MGSCAALGTTPPILPVRTHTTIYTLLRPRLLTTPYELLPLRCPLPIFLYYGALRAVPAAYAHHEADRFLTLPSNAHTAAHHTPHAPHAHTTYRTAHTHKQEEGRKARRKKASTRGGGQGWAGGGRRQACRGSEGRGRKAISVTYQQHNLLPLL